MMLTTDLALRFDPAYEKISRRFKDNPEEFEAAFAKAWFKLTHRDMGPVTRLVGPEVPEAQIWQDPVPALDHPLVGANDIKKLKKAILASGASVSDLVKVAWASASSYRDTDRRGGVNGARVRLAPQKDWAANEPAVVTDVISKLEKVQADFNKTAGRTKVSLADLIVLGGAAAIEAAADKAGMSITVPFVPGRTDATAEMTDAASFDVLEPENDGFRNYVGTDTEAGTTITGLVDKASLLRLTAPEMTVLVGGLRALGATHGTDGHGVFTDTPGTLTNDFFVNLMDMDIEWQKASTEGIYEGRHRETGKVMHTATAVDLVFGSNSQLRALAEVYASDDAKPRFARDFVAAWTKVMKLDRFDLK